MSLLLKSGIAIAVLATAITATTSLALAQDPGVNAKPDATITMGATAAAAGVGYTWGNGVLHYHGHSYPFSVKGLSVLDVGFAKIGARGRVYHLNRVADFSGTYAAATGEATLGNGIGGQIMRNGNGVMIRVDEVTKGARLAGSGDGIQLTLQ